MDVPLRAASYSESPHSSVAVRLFAGQVLSAAGLQVVDEVFDRFDIDMTESLGATELEQILSLSVPHKSPAEISVKIDQLLCSFDCASAGQLSKAGFRESFSCGHKSSIHGAVVGIFNKTRVLMASLVALGYDSDLNLVGARSCVISIHSEEPLSVSVMKSDPGHHIFEEAMELPIIHSADVSDFDSLKLFKERNGYTGASFVASNESETETAIVTFEVSGKNVMSCKGSSTFDACGAWQGVELQLQLDTHTRTEKVAVIVQICNVAEA